MDVKQAKLSRTRVEMALANSVADRPPYSAWGHRYDIEHSAEELVRHTLEVVNMHGWDWVKPQIRETCFAEALGVGFTPSADGRSHPTISAAFQDTQEFWQDVISRATAPEMPAPLQEQIEIIRVLRRELGPDMPLQQTVFSPMSVLGYLVGRDQGRAVALFREKQEQIGRVLAAIAGMLSRFIASSLAAGADGVFFAVVGYASRRYFSEQEYRAFLLSHDLAALDVPEQGWFNTVHLCFDQVSFALADEFPVQAVSWSCTDEGNPSLEDAASQTRLARMSGIDRYSILRGEQPDEVASEGRDVLGELGPEGLLWSPGCSVSPWPTERGSYVEAFVSPILGLSR